MQTNIYEMLKSGRTAEDLAAEFTSMLNEAEAQVKAEEEAARLEAENEANMAAYKQADMEDLLEDFVDYLDTYYPEMIADQEIDYTEIATAVISLLDTIGNASTMQEMLMGFKLLRSFGF